MFWSGDQNIFPFFGRSKVEIKIQSPGTHEIERIFQKIKSLKTVIMKLKVFKALIIKFKN